MIRLLPLIALLGVLAPAGAHQLPGNVSHSHPELDLAHDQSSEQAENLSPASLPVSDAGGGLLH